MRRRELVTLIGGASVMWPLAARAQALRLFTIGIISPAASDSTPVFNAFRTRLQELGYVEGRSIRLDFYLTKGQPELVRRLADDIVRTPPDVIVADGALIVRTLKELTTSIPIVGILGPDPVASGLIASLARPDANITGVTTLGLDLHPKRAELLKEAVPQLSRLGLLWDRDNDPGGLMLGAMEGYAKRVGLSLKQMEGGRAEAIASSLSPAGLSGVDAVLVSSGPAHFAIRQTIVKLIGAVPGQLSIRSATTCSWAASCPTVRVWSTCFADLRSMLTAFSREPNPATSPSSRWLASNTW